MGYDDRRGDQAASTAETARREAEAGRDRSDQTATAIAAARVTYGQLEVAVRVAGALLNIADRRLKLVYELGEAVRNAVEELDGDRDTDPSWWQESTYGRADSFDRLRRGFDDLILIETQAEEICRDLRRGLNVAQGLNGDEARPSLTPVQANARLFRLALNRALYIHQMQLAERVLRPRMTRPISQRLRRSLTVIRDSERRAAFQRVELIELLAGVTVGGSAPFPRR